ncbi:LysR family transcriptional regulator [Caballeronia terrestris]|uniref:LysR family transcriptional regulator n=1 Tax=Caballeronia terrestris TaxID=1226301 RepID=A0A158GQT2_9BURK|nr:LysR family transcriptional regulator [Caballeronia terrestris]SAL34425.1 LysR family transcriptional regulator [Caballeronia terrestris]
MNTMGLFEAETFLMVAECGGFGAAARELGVTQSTISRRVSILEGRLGVRLIERTTRHVALTDAGLSYADELRDILLRLRQADERAQRRTAEPEGLLRITMPTAFGRACVVPCLARLATRYSRLRFEVDLSDRYADLLEGNHDVAVRLATTAQSGISEQRIASVALCLCASPAYLALRGPVSEPAQIVDHDCLALRTYAPRTSWHVIWQDRAAEVNFVPKMVVSDLFALADLCRAGLGVAVLPMYAAASALEDGSLIDAAPALRFPDLDVFAAYARDREKLPKIAALIEELKQIGDLAAPSR